MNASTLRPRDGESSLVGVFGGFDAPARLAAAQFYLRGCNATQLGRFTLCQTRHVPRDKHGPIDSRHAASNSSLSVKQTSTNKWWLWARAASSSPSVRSGVVPLRRRQLAPAHRARVLGLEPLQDARLAVKPVRARQLVARLADGDVGEADAARGRLSVLCERWCTGRTVRRSVSVSS